MRDRDTCEGDRIALFILVLGMWLVSVISIPQPEEIKQAIRETMKCQQE